MEIDARGLEDPGPLRLLRDALRSDESLDDEIIVLVDSLAQAKKVETFSGFTGSLTEKQDAGDHWRVSVRRMCNCG